MPEIWVFCIKIVWYIFQNFSPLSLILLFRIFPFYERERERESDSTIFVNDTCTCSSPLWWLTERCLLWIGSDVYELSRKCKMSWPALFDEFKKKKGMKKSWRFLKLQIVISYFLTLWRFLVCLFCGGLMKSEGWINKM